MLHITDTHLHLWDLSRFKLPWLSAVAELNHDVNWQDYHALVNQDAWCIDRALYVEVDVAPEQRGEESLFLQELCSDPGNFVEGGIISLDMQRPEAVARWLARGEHHPAVKGVRHVLHVASQPSGACLTSDFINNVNALGNAGLCFEICLRNEDLADAVQLAERTSTTLVLNHMGNVDSARLKEEASYAANWRRNLSALAQQRHVWCKVSGVNIPAGSDSDRVRPVVEQCLETFAADRVVFASNYPVCSLSTGLIPWVNTLVRITDGQGRTWQQRFFSHNAQQLYRLAEA
ncbi:amidohydrolase [Citrobacter amalonaticus]|uniref:Amidohydrolase n=1 Tax=Citrobacter amalonaticus TaxID=35703 RepID=A0A2S4RT27_CITAM|nr:amidohydrolase family protein [Citrobacter amalonaticus]POT56884.1 amidohydrolase [Citrobacter amalonaticus]POT71871.1 amidohydrolase [Citrobacter amalonaticus]POU63011.1 amidohydrolase [Citrobacter amalonaticus]POV04775.1 amidohydrolase [Citrobacter amalonaticus]